MCVYVCMYVCVRACVCESVCVCIWQRKSNINWLAQQSLYGCVRFSRLDYQPHLLGQAPYNFHWHFLRFNWLSFPLAAVNANVLQRAKLFGKTLMKLNADETANKLVSHSSTVAQQVSLFICFFYIFLPTFNYLVQPFYSWFWYGSFFLERLKMKWQLHQTLLCLDSASELSLPNHHLHSWPPHTHSQDFYWSYPHLSCDIIILASLENPLLTLFPYSLLIYIDLDPQHVC